MLICVTRPQCVKPNIEVRSFRYTDDTRPSSITSEQTKGFFQKYLINYALTAVHRFSLFEQSTANATSNWSIQSINVIAEAQKAGATNVCTLVSNTYFLVLGMELLYVTFLAPRIFRWLLDRGGTVVKVLCYKEEGRWFDPRWFHWNFSLT